ncbi:MAG TPA: hypothetical protein VJA44_08765 [Acidimicrobiia bacterium]|nr:hypothetical protein [Acidimicrobiia bacterium]
MKTNRIPEQRPTDDLTAAREALAALDAESVERCPEPDCGLCGPALPAAA